MMAKRSIAFGVCRLDKEVEAYLKKKGIDPNEVLAYSIVRSLDESILTLKLLFDANELMEEGASDG